MKDQNLLRIVPPAALASGLTNTRGTKIFMDDTQIRGVTRIEIICGIDDVWRARIECTFDPTDLSSLSMEFKPTMWQRFKLWWRNLPPAREGGR